MPATPRLSTRVIARLVQAEACEHNPHFVDDLRIARLTVHYAASGEAVVCSPHVLASYMVLGVHPDKVWSKIQERRNALEKFSGWKLPPKKPPVSAVGRSHEKLWYEKTNAARVTSSHGAHSNDLRDRTISVPMATAQSLAAGYPNSDAPSSGKKGEYFYEEAIRIIKRSGAPDHVRQLTIDALAIRGDWTKKKGPITNIITVSVRSLQDEGGVHRSTIQRRIRRAQKDRFWRATRTTINRWLKCPKCGAERESAQCPKCPHKGNGLNPNEFPRTIAYAIDFEKFERTPPCRQVREIRLKKGELREMPAPVAEPPAAQEVKQPAAEHAHRNPARQQPKLSKTEAAKFIAEAAQVMRTERGPQFGPARPDCERCSGKGIYATAAHPGHAIACECTTRLPHRPTWREALSEVCGRWQREQSVVIEALKFWGHSIPQEE